MILPYIFIMYKSARSLEVDTYLKLGMRIYLSYCGYIFFFFLIIGSYV